MFVHCFVEALAQRDWEAKLYIYHSMWLLYFFSVY